MKTCIDCGNSGVVERRRCKQCVLLHNRQRVKKYHRKNKPRYGIINCSLCGEQMIKNRPTQHAHGKCRKKVIAEKSVNYNKVRRANPKETVGRNVITSLGLNVKYLVVHHIDENPDNNVLSNLMIISRSNHGKLHRYLDNHWSLFKKLDSSNSENCWDTLRGQLTTTWLETTGVKVIKITDIGQSAAEPLNKDYIYIFE
jgi:hypothetical protein